MAKHAVFALIFMAIIAFSTVSAYKTTIVTTIIEGNKRTWPYNGLGNGRGYVDGLGLHNGQGLVDGMDNGQGLVDGLANGQGLVDGLDSGQGLVDGLANGQGLVDGLDNGQGLVDGLDNGRGLVDGLDNPTSSQQCRSQIPIEQVNHCKMHLTQGIIFGKMAVRPFKHDQEQHLQQCCSQLKQVREQCQCAAIQQALNRSLATKRRITQCYRNCK
uniref:PawS-like protein 1a n=1 Tax=Bidens pilosa TaxID=42337 RepID=A0A1V0JB56_BIDPI|nr:PawS-like protein 1a [Bidens pilosa]